MILFLILCIIVLYVVVNWINLLRDAKDSNFPGPTPLPVIGNGNLFLVDSNLFFQIFTDLSQKYGDVYRVHMMSHRMIILSHPKYVDQLISSSETITKGNSYTFLEPWLGDGLLVSTGPKWRSHRKFLTPAFHYNILHSFLPIFLKNVRILSENLRGKADGSLVELFPIVTLCTLDNITETIMGLSFDAQKDRESAYVKSLNVTSKILTTRAVNVFMAIDALFALTPYKKTLDKELAFLHKHTDDVIEKRRRELKKIKANKLDETSDIGLKNKHAFLDLLLLAEVDGKAIDDKSVRDEVETFMFEGHDTTASGIVFGLYCLSKYQDVQQRVLQEQLDILGEDLEREPTFTELQEMKYLDCVIKESLRLFPSVPLIERLITKDVEMSGLRFKKNTSVTINIYNMHRHPDVFENPLEFRPERFEASSSFKGPFSWIPFSAGPRNCIGQKFAMLEIKVTLASLVRRFKLLPWDQEPKLCFDLVLRSRNGVCVKILPRETTKKI